MSWDILPDVAWKSAVVLGITLALLHLVKDRSAAQRAWIAHIGLFVTLALPLAVIMMPRWEVAAAPVADLAAPVQAIFESPIVQDVATPSLATISAPALPTLSETLMGLLPDTGTLVLLAWGLPALALLLVMLVAVTRLFSLRNRASVMVEQSWLGALAQAQMRMNFKHGTALLVSSEISSPVSWGVMRPVILLSEASVNNRGDAEAIIAHELAHVSRLDWAGLLLGRIVTALFWFNPMAWILARQAHQLREEAADDSVLRSNVDRIDYAALLVGAARHEARGFLLAANGVAPSRGSLKRRITRVLDEHQLRAPAYLGWMSACVLGAVLVALPLAAFSATREVEIAQAQTPLAMAQAATPQATIGAYDPKYDAFVFTPPKPNVAAPSAAAWTNARERALELAREIRENEREKAQEIAERDRERAQDSARREREKLFDLVKRAQEMAEREQERLERGRDNADNVRAKAESTVKVDAQRETVTIDVPGIFIQATPDGATVRAPGVDIRANPQSATIRAPGVNIQANADAMERSGSRSANMAGSQSGVDSGRQSGAGSGIEKPTANELVKMAVLGIDRGYREDIASAGYNLNIDELHQLRIHGMNGQWLRRLARVGYDRLSVKQISNFAIHRVTSDFAQAMVDRSATKPTPEQLVQLRIHNGELPGASRDKDKNKDKAKTFD